MCHEIICILCIKRLTYGPEIGLFDMKDGNTEVFSTEL